MTHQTLRAAVAARQAEWDSENRLTALYHAVELANEVGEALGCLKKIERARLGLAGSTSSENELREELGDVLISLLLLANVLGIDVEAEARRKFNARSKQLGFSTRVETADLAPGRSLLGGSAAQDPSLSVFDDRVATGRDSK